ncbi:MAG: hypothetical protein RRZ83_07270 [Alistipes sp.]
MKKTIKGIALAVWSIILFFSASCSKTPPDDDLNSSATIDVRLRIKNSGGYASNTRALTTAQETDINEVYVLAFKDAVLSYICKAKEVDNAKKTFTVSLKASESTNDAYSLMVLANVGTSINALIDAFAKHEKTFTVADVQALVSAPVSSKLYTTDPKQIPLWGEVSGKKVISNSTGDLAVTLLRCVARVDVGVGQATELNGAFSWDGETSGGTKIPFTLKEIYLFRPNNQYTIIPLTENYDSAQGKVTAHSAVGTRIAAADSPAGFTYTHITNALYSTQDIYCPESDVRITSTGTSGDSNHLNRMALVVGGSYNGQATSYYRLDFTSGGGKTLIDVLRNHLYRFNITNVKGNGFATPLEGYQSLAVNMSVTVLDWTSGTENISFDGTHYFYIQSKRITLQGNKNLSGHISVGSDIAPSDWEMSLDGATFTKNTTVSNANFTVTKPSVADGGFLTITTLQVAASQVTSTLTLRAGRLQFKITIVQDPDAPQEWYLGGDYETNL